jgi:hypothetical protein
VAPSNDPQRLLLGRLDEPEHRDIERTSVDPIDPIVPEMAAASEAVRTEAPPTAAAPAARSVPWWRRPRGQAGLAAASLVLAAFSAVMLGTVHGLQRRALRLQDAATKAAAAAPSGPLAVWLAPGFASNSGAAARIPESDLARGLRATLALPSGRPAPVYIASVRDAGGIDAWSSGPAVATGGRVTIVVPAGVLRGGEYRIVLRGGTAVASVTDVAVYKLTVE